MLIGTVAPSSDAIWELRSAEGNSVSLISLDLEERIVFSAQRPPGILLSGQRESVVVESLISNFQTVLHLHVVHWQTNSTMYAKRQVL